MKLSCTQANLLKGVATVSRITSPRPTLPVLANIYCAAEKGRLRLSATDLEIGITTWIGAKVEQEGATTVPARTFYELVANNADETIDISVENSKLTLKSSHHEAHVNGIAASEFPLIPEVKKEFSLSIPGLLFKEAIEQVVFTAATDETRPVLTGVLIKADKNQVKFVATDSFRLAEKTISLANPVGSIQVIIPARPLQEAARLIEPSIEAVELALSQNQLKMTTGSTELVSRLLEGTFPDYEQIIPKDTKTTVEVDRAKLVAALRAANIFAKDSAGSLVIRLNEERSLIVEAMSQELGSNKTTVPAKRTGEPLEVSFNIKFLLDGLNAIPSDDVVAQFRDKFSPALLKPEQDPGYLYLVMPLKLEA
ncbi:DNA polymerase III subunit beta [Candidatus Berkelbacteria bacterium]|nr:DNA polymerase III subunit beta [Candidatus Berkelbacteria bacterium]